MAVVRMVATILSCEDLFDETQDQHFRKMGVPDKIRKHFQMAQSCGVIVGLLFLHLLPGFPQRLLNVLKDIRCDNVHNVTMNNRIICS